MGLFDLAKELHELVHDGLKEIGESVADLVEYTTVGFFKEVICDEQYETSFEKRDKAKHIISKAENSLEELETKVNNTLNEVNKTQKTLINKEKTVLKKCKIQLSGNTKDVQVSTRTYKDFTQIYAPTFSSIGFDKGTFTGGLAGFYIRNKIADNYLEDAYDFEVEAKAIKAKTNATLAKIKHIENCMKEELALLIMVEKIVKNNEDVNYEDLVNIIESIIVLPFQTKSGTLSSKYSKEIKKLRGVLYER